MLSRSTMIALDLQILACEALKLGMTYMASQYMNGRDLIRAVPNGSVDLYESGEEVVWEGKAMFANISLAFTRLGQERGHEYAQLMDKIMQSKHQAYEASREGVAIILGPSGGTDERGYLEVKITGPGGDA